MTGIFENEKWEEVYVTAFVSNRCFYSFHRRVPESEGVSPHKKPEEFLRVIKDITGETTIDDGNFEHIIPPCFMYLGGGRAREDDGLLICKDGEGEDEKCINCDGTIKCLCSQNIENRTFIKHLDSGKMLCVGRCCILKIAPENSRIVLSLTKFHCINCSNLLPDRKGNIRGEMFCNEECQIKFYNTDDTRRYSQYDWKKCFNKVFPQLKDRVAFIENKKKQEKARLEREKARLEREKRLERLKSLCECGVVKSKTPTGTYYPRCFNCESKREKEPCKKCGKPKPKNMFDVCFNCKN